MLKKISSFLIIVSLVILSLNFVSADNFPLDVNDSTKDFTQSNAQFVLEGQKDLSKIKARSLSRGIPSADEYINLRMKHYYQNGETWSGDIMEECGRTIGSAGCALTSFTMITDYYGYNDDPGEVNLKLGKYACPLAWSAAGSKYNLTLEGSVHYEVSDNYAKDYIRGALRRDRPVIVGLTKGGSTHFVVARGYLKESYDPDSGLYNREYFNIYDPSSNKDCRFLEDYLDEGYKVHRLKVYDE